MIITAGNNTVKFQFDAETFAIYPKAKLIAISDDSEMVSFKLLASRKTIFAEKYSSITPHDSDAKSTVEMLNEIL